MRISLKIGVATCAALALCAVAFAPVGVSAAKEEGSAEAPAAPKTGKVYTVTIEGMDCDGCVKSCTKKLKKIEGAVDAKVDLESKTATITMAEGKELAIEAVTKALEGTNFTASNLAEKKA